MTISLFDSRRREKRPFQPNNPALISMYVCGPTVYNYIHIGNARPAVVFDVLYRLLQRKIAPVKFVRNITDIDDKINDAAQACNQSIQDFTAKYIHAYREDLAQLNCLAPSLEPLATQNISSMIELITTLLDKGHAYCAQDHVLFDVSSMADYGALARRSQDELLAGARVEIAPYKKNSSDFVLWKPSQPPTPGWQSPWGFGRPGWHIECSAMIKAHLGAQIDIHGGGIDLTFPHHENERAQSNCCSDAEFVNVWMHNGYINMAGEKMSKSLGNFVTVRSLLEQYHGDVLRYALLNAHYRAPLEWSKTLLEQARSSLNRFYQIMRDEPTLSDQTPEQHPPEQQAQAQSMLTAFDAALCDDLNTPQAFAHLHTLAGQYFKAKPADKATLALAVRLACNALGLVHDSAQQWFQADVSRLDIQAIEATIQARQQAKSEKNYLKADTLRAELAAQGIILEDKPDGTRWHQQ